MNSGKGTYLIKTASDSATKSFKREKIGMIISLFKTTQVYENVNWIRFYYMKIFF